LEVFVFEVELRRLGQTCVTGGLARGEVERAIVSERGADPLAV